MSFDATVLSLYPDMFPGPLGTSLAGRALERGDWSLEARQIRDHATDRHRSVLDFPRLELVGPTLVHLAIVGPHPVEGRPKLEQPGLALSDSDTRYDGVWYVGPVTASPPIGTRYKYQSQITPLLRPN